MILFSEHIKTPEESIPSDGCFLSYGLEASVQTEAVI